MAAANPAVAVVEPQPQRHMGLRPIRPVAAVCLCGVFAFLNLYATQPLLPMLTAIFHATKAAVGLTVSVSTLGVALAAPILGALTERVSRKRVIVLSIVVLAAPTVLAATSPGLRTLLFWRFMQGLAMPGIFATVITYIGEEWRRESIALVMSLYVSATACGGFLGRFLTGLIAETLSWRWSFVALGALTLLGAGSSLAGFHRKRSDLTRATNPSPAFGSRCDTFGIRACWPHSASVSELCSHSSPPSPTAPSTSPIRLSVSQPWRSAISLQFTLSAWWSLPLADIS